MLSHGQLGKCTISTKRPLPNPTRCLKTSTVPSYLTIPLYTTLPYLFCIQSDKFQKIKAEWICFDRRHGASPETTL